MAEFTTMEEARAEVLRLEELNQALTQERDTLSQDNNRLSGELESVRTLNQQYYLKLRAQYSQQEDKNDEEEKEVPSCEDFAKTLNIL